MPSQMNLLSAVLLVVVLLPVVMADGSGMYRCICMNYMLQATDII